MAAFRKALSRRISQLVNTAAASPPRRCHPDPDPLRRIVPSFLQKRPIFQPALPPDRLFEQLRYLNPDRIRLDLLLSSAPNPAPCLPADEDGTCATGSAVKKLGRAVRMDAAMARLRATGRSCISYSEFLQICGAADVARSLDEAGLVIVWGNVVSLRPEEVAKVIDRVIVSQTHPAWSEAESKELLEMEREKAEIDRRAAVHVKRERWCVLGIFLVPTVASMRVTFWDLTWDVMEPVCFYVSSAYFLACYAFFMRTSREPTFDNFFKNRFAVWQRRLMRSRSFNVERFNELRRACPTPPAS